MIEKYCEDEKFYGEPNTWDVTLVTDMSELFKNMKEFNAPIDQWNTSQVTDMNGMFVMPRRLTNRSRWIRRRFVWMTCLMVQMR